MTIYRFGDNSVIDEVAVRHSGGGGVRAYIHARDGADPKELEAIKKALTDESMYWTPMEHEGKAVIEVRHIGANGRKLLQFLDKQKMTTGTPAKEVNPENRITFKTKLKNNLLRLSGVLYTAGDLAFIYNGWKDAFKSSKLGDLFKKDNLTHTGVQTLLGGIFYAAGSPVITFFGRGDKSDIQLRHMSYDAMQYLESKGVKIPEDASIRSVTFKHNSNPWRILKSKLERYPAEICNSLFGIAGGMMVWSGIKKSRLIRSGESQKSLTAAYADVGLGVATILAGAVSLVEEEPRQPGEPRKKGMAGVWQFVKEKPLRMAGILLGVSTVGHTVNAVSAYHKAHNPPPNLTPEQLQEVKSDAEGVRGRIGFAATNLAAEVAMSFASKGHGEGVESDVSLKPSTYAVMADLVERSPAEKRVEILDHISSYLSKEENLNLDKDEIRAGISAQMEKNRSNPWLSGAKAVFIDKVVENEVPKSETEWQDMLAKMNTSELSGTPVTR